MLYKKITVFITLIALLVITLPGMQASTAQAAMPQTEYKEYLSKVHAYLSELKTSWLEMTSSFANNTQTGQLTGSTNVVPTGLQHYYDLNESGGTVASDSVGNVNGSLLGGTTFTTGAIGNAAVFDGDDNSINIGAINVPGNQMTLSMFIKADDFGIDDARLISKATGVQEQDHTFMVSTIYSGGGEKLRFRLKTNDVTSTLIGNTNISANQWTHIVAVYDGSNMILYQNGDEVGRTSKSGSITQNSAVTTIGINPDGYGSFDGLIDDVRIYNRALSVSEVSSINDSNSDIPNPPPPPTTSDTHYIRAGASGNGSGDDWNNAYTDLPSTLQRGHTYYVSDGTYGGYTFDDANSGTQLITIKKAIQSDHGTNTGWQSSYGDGQAVFANQLNFTTSYWLMDGVTGGGPTQWTTGHGFKVTEMSGIPAIRTSSARFITLRHMEVVGNDGSNQGGGSVGNDAYAFYGGGNILVSHSYAHDMGRTIIFGGSDNTTFEYNYTGDFTSTNSTHAEIASIWNFSGTPTNNWVFRHNIFGHIEGTGGLIMEGNGLDVYGNTFFRPAGVTYGVGNGAVGTWTSSALTNIKIYNNSFIDLSEMPAIGILDGADTGILENNIFYRTKTGSTGGLVMRNNDSVTVDPFKDYLALDFRLKSASFAGGTLATPYNIDVLGNVRGADGTWDRGAIEYTGTTPNPTPTVTLTASPSSHVLTGSSVLTWSSTNADTCTGTGFTANNTSGSFSVSPFVTTEFSISCTGPGGTTNKSVTVTVIKCLGTLPPNAWLYNNDKRVDTLGLITDTAKSYSPTDTATKCEFYCAPGYSWNSNACTLAPKQTLSANILSTKFTSGSQISVLGEPLNVRQDPNGLKSGSQTIGVTGVITSGPIKAGNYTWWQVDFDTGVDGWVVEDFIGG